MTFEPVGEAALDYLPCRYGDSKLLFRGPRRDLTRPYIAFLGGTETYGKFIADPFVSLLEQRLDLTCVNFGCLNAGVDVFLNDPFLPQAASKARMTVLQVPGAQNLSNRLYTVHPRRNDRFVSATGLLHSIYPDVDFATFHFNKHLLQHLRTLSEERYWIVEQELRNAWIARMQSLLQRISGRVLLVWISTRDPDDVEHITVDPMHVTGEMLDLVEPHATEFRQINLSEAAVSNPLEGMVFSQMEAPAAREMLGPQAHGEIADALLPMLTDMMM